MSRSPLRLLGEVIALVAIAAAPLGSYAGIRALSREDASRWPADLIVVGEAAGTLEGIVLVHFRAGAGAPVVVSWPAETLVEGGRGRLRPAAAAFELEGPEGVAEGLAASIPVEIPFWAVGTAGTGPIPERLVRHNLAGREADADRLLEPYRSGRESPLPAPGSFRSIAGVQTFVPDVATLVEILSGVRAARPAAASPAPGPTAVLRDVSVEVLAGPGAPEGRAADLANRLRREGFEIVLVGDVQGGTVAGIVVYYREDRRSGREVERALGDLVDEFRRLPPEYRTRADVVVVVGSPS